MAAAGTAAPEPAPAGNRLRIRQVEVLYHQAPVAVSGTLAAAVILVAILWPVASAGTLLTWFGILLVISLVRAWGVLRYHHAGESRRGDTQWIAGMLGGAAASGITWGLATALLPPSDSVIHMGFTTLWACGLAAGSIASLSAVRWAFAAFVVPATLPAAAYLIAHGGTPEMTMGGGVLLFTGFLTFNGLRMHESVTESLRLQFENDALIADLAAEKRQIERLNAELEARVAERTAELSAANAAKSRFLGAASHDLRQPLQALTLMQGSLSAMALEPPAGRIVEEMGEGLRVAGDMLDGLLDITRLDSGGIRPRITDVPVAQVCDRLGRELRRAAEQKGLALRLVPSRAVVRTDPALLERILRNLLSNAVKYTDRGKILLGCRRAGGSIRVEVWDTGRGIPADQLGHVFEEFYQLGNPARERGKGQGLGLAIVERTARILGHPLSVRSAPGRGSVFTVAVPTGDPAAVSRTQPAPHRAAAGRADGLRLVLVEDDPDVRDAMGVLLRLRGFQVQTGRTGGEALAHCEAAGLRPDLAIVDYRLPEGETGIDVVARLRHGPGGSAMPAILLTGDTSPELEQTASRNGCRLLRKPVEPQVLISIIQQAAASPQAVG